MPNEGLVEGSELVALPIRIVDVAGNLDVDEAGVATFHTDTGSDFRWLPLTDAIPGQDQSLLVTGEARRGARITITVAASREHARHGYVARTAIEVAQGVSRAAPLVTLVGAVHPVRFELPTDTDRAGPLRLQRVDDRQWLPMRHGTSGITLATGVETVLLLGAGDYEVSDPLDPGAVQRFSVPEVDVVEVSRDLTKARGDRL